MGLALAAGLALGWSEICPLSLAPDALSLRTIVRTFWFIAGVVGMFLPLLFLVLARKSARQAVRDVVWRTRIFKAGLTGTELSYAWFWMAILGLPIHTSIETLQRVRWVSESAAIMFLALTFAGNGAARVLAILAALGVATLWTSIGIR